MAEPEEEEGGGGGVNGGVAQPSRTSQIAPTIITEFNVLFYVMQMQATCPSTSIQFHLISFHSIGFDLRNGPIEWPDRLFFMCVCVCVCVCVFLMII